MADIDVFTVRELRQRTGRLIQDAENGKMSLITRYGRPWIMALPFGERLLELGVGRALAVQLFEAGIATLSQAAKVADMTLGDFLNVLREADVPAVDYPPEELDEEMKVALQPHFA